MVHVVPQQIQKSSGTDTDVFTEDPTTADDENIVFFLSSAPTTADAFTTFVGSGKSSLRAIHLSAYLGGHAHLSVDIGLQDTARHKMLPGNYAFYGI
jgi:hypothetical protein